MNPILLAAVATSVGDKIDKMFYGFDTWFFSFLGSMQSDFMTIVAKFFTTFGDEKFLIPMVLFGAVLCFFKKTRKYGFAIMLAMGLGAIVTNLAIKPMFLRVRPYNTMQMTDFWPQFSQWYFGAGTLSESDFSFPSGHSTGAVDVAVALFLCFRADGKKKIAWVFPVIAVCTMFSRVYLMVHYMTDTIAGMIIGICAGVAAYFIAKLACWIMSKVKFLDAIDLSKLFKKLDAKKSKTLAAVAICVVVCGLFLNSFIPSLTEGGSDVVRCSYSGEYDCYNEAKCEFDEEGNPVYRDKYPEIPGYEGQFFCKIHHSQLSDTEE